MPAFVRPLPLLSGISVQLQERPSLAYKKHWRMRISKCDKPWRVRYAERLGCVNK